MRKKPFVLPLVLALMLATFTWSQAQEQLQVLISGDRNAAIKIHSTEGEPGLTGDIKASADLAAGKSALRGDLVIQDAAEMGEAKAQAYSKLTARTVELIGNLNLPVPPGEADMPETLDAELESVTDDKKSYATGKFDLVVATPEEIPTVKVDGNVEGSAKEFGGKVNYAFTMPAGQGAQIPVSSLNLTLNDEADVTTLVLTVATPKDSQFAPQLKMLPGMQDMLKQQLTQTGFQVDKVEIPQPEENDTEVTAKVTVAIKELRKTLSGFIDQAGPSMANDPSVDPQVMTSSLKSMIAPKINNFEFTLKVAGDDVSGALSGKLVDLGPFFKGYVDMVTMVMKQTQDETYADAGPLAPYLKAFQELNMQQASKALEVLAETSMTFKADGEFSMEGIPAETPQEGQEAAPGKLKMNGNFNFTADNYQDYVTKAKAKGLPVAEKGLVLADLELKDKKQLDGHFYLMSEGDALDYYKKLLAQAISEGGNAEASKVVEGLELKDAAFSLNLNGTNLNVAGYSETSDLTKAAEALLQAAAPQVQGTLTGVGVDYTFAEGAKGEGDVAIYFSNFMPGKSAAEVKQALGLPASAEVVESADAQAVTLVAVEKPEIEMASELASIQSEAQKLLESPVANVPGGEAGGGGGGVNWMLIIGGVLVLGLVGVGLAAGRKSA